eukprot:scaffold1772_cov80-Cylindrotheca_fusiformis.AAC.17
MEFSGRMMASNHVSVPGHVALADKDLHVLIGANLRDTDLGPNPHPRFGPSLYVFLLVAK